ncbi:SURF1 family protein [Actinacidiphila acididurans]|uniref:SURF1-like protein n=1 Tax=Actinacidiphila acididurans TaxID=2784346 RepID=A0ABS2U6N3_9ACTN|nr:SURF1 family protein [Actinacidiphila acididurans]MBM9510682.1 SURF1 family protein [Actinacidiphila acididurans]
MYRFLLAPRWLAVSALALLAVPFCVFMGSWQLSRFDMRVAQHRTAKHDSVKIAAEAPVPLASVLPNVRAQVPGADSGRQISATGSYDAGHQLLVPDRTLDGRNGFYVLTPLRVGGGAALPVVRGWLPGDASAAERSRSIPAAPAGQVTVTGALQNPESTDTSGVSASGALPSGQLGIISAASLVNVLPYPVYGGWITAAHPSAPLKAVPPAAPPNSGLDLKAFQNLGYTGQWFVFAAFVVFMWFRLIRREAEARADAALGLLPEEDDGVPEGPGPGPGGVDAGPDAERTEGSAAHVA